MSLFNIDSEYTIQLVNVENTHIKIVGLSPNNKYLIVSYWSVFNNSTILIFDLETLELYFKQDFKYEKIISYFNDDDIYLVYTNILNNRSLNTNVEKVSLIPNSNKFTTTVLFEKRISKKSFDNITDLGTIQNLIISPNNKFIVIQYDYFNTDMETIPQFYILYINDNIINEIGHINVESVYKKFFPNSDFSFLYNFNNSITFSRDGQYLYFIPGTKIKLDLNEIVDQENNGYRMNDIDIQKYITYPLSNKLINRNINPKDPELFGYIMDIGKPNIYVYDYIGVIFGSNRQIYNNNIIIYNTSNNVKIVEHKIESHNTPNEMQILPGKLGKFGATHYLINALSRASGRSAKDTTTTSLPVKIKSKRRHYKNNKTRKNSYKSKPADVLHDMEAIEMLNEFEENGKISVLMNNGNILFYSGTTNNELLQTLDEFQHKSMIFSNDGKICYAYRNNPHSIIKYVCS